MGFTLAGYSARRIGALARAECALDTVHEAGDPKLVTGRVLHPGVGTGGPLLFYRCTYGLFSR